LFANCSGSRGFAEFV